MGLIRQSDSGCSACAICICAQASRTACGIAELQCGPLLEMRAIANKHTRTCRGQFKLAMLRLRFSMPGHLGLASGAGDVLSASGDCLRKRQPEWQAACRCVARQTTHIAHSTLHGTHLISHQPHSHPHPHPHPHPIIAHSHLKESSIAYMTTYTV